MDLGPAWSRLVTRLDGFGLAWGKFRLGGLGVGMGQASLCGNEGLGLGMGKVWIGLVLCWVKLGKARLRLVLGEFWAVHPKVRFSIFFKKSTGGPQYLLKYGFQNPNSEVPISNSGRVFEKSSCVFEKVESCFRKVESCFRKVDSCFRKVES